MPDVLETFFFLFIYLFFFFYFIIFFYYYFLFFFFYFIIFFFIFFFYFFIFFFADNFTLQKIQNLIKRTFLFCVSIYKKLDEMFSLGQHVEGTLAGTLTRGFS